MSRGARRHIALNLAGTANVWRQPVAGDLAPTSSTQSVYRTGPMAVGFPPGSGIAAVPQSRLDVFGSFGAQIRVDPAAAVVVNASARSRKRSHSQPLLPRRGGLCGS
jgi:hypothetical protein